MMESSIARWQYWTAIVMIVVLVVHLVPRALPGSWGRSLEWDYVVSNYKNAVYVVTLVALLVAGLFHGFNGLRIIVGEWLMNDRVVKGVSIFLILLGLLLGALGLATFLGIQLISL